MNNNKKAIIIFFALTARAFASDKYRDVERMQDIKEHVNTMVKICNQKCSVTTDVLQGCTSNCLQEFSQRTERYWIRRYTASCQGLQQTGTFNFYPTEKQECEELMGTIKAYDAWKNPQIEQCVRSKIKEHNRRAQSLLRSARSDLADVRQEHPWLAKGQDIVDFFRRRN